MTFYNAVYCAVSCYLAIANLMRKKLLQKTAVAAHALFKKQATNYRQVPGGCAVAEIFRNCYRVS